MSNEIIHKIPGLVDVSYRADLKAVYLKWFSEYDEGSRVKQVVFAALDFVRAHNVRHWLADLATSRQGLTAADQEWVGSEAFRDAIRNSPLRKFVLMPPLPETGQDVTWLADWERNTLAQFGDRVEAMLSGGPTEIRNFFGT